MQRVSKLIGGLLIALGVGAGLVGLPGLAAALSGAVAPSAGSVVVLLVWGAAFVVVPLVVIGLGWIVYNVR